MRGHLWAHGPGARGVLAPALLGGPGAADFLGLMPGGWGSAAWHWLVPVPTGRLVAGLRPAWPKSTRSCWAKKALEEFRGSVLKRIIKLGMQ